MSSTQPVPLATLQAQCSAMLEQLLPTGLAWPRPLGADMQAIMDSAASELGRVKDRARQALREMDPRTTTELLAEWEQLVGLPDDCELEEIVSLQERRFRLVAKLNESGGQSAAFYIGVALTLGYAITIEEGYQPFQVGLNGAGEPIGGEGWLFHWTVHAPKFTPSFFTVGSSAVGEALAEWSNERLECFLERIRPAHTSVSFVYDLQVTGYAPWGTYVCPIGGVPLNLTAYQNHQPQP